jgi:hypothetical protein
MASLFSRPVTPSSRLLFMLSRISLWLDAKPVTIPALAGCVTSRYAWRLTSLFASCLAGGGPVLTKPPCYKFFSYWWCFESRCTVWLYLLGTLDVSSGVGHCGPATHASVILLYLLVLSTHQGCGAPSRARDTCVPVILARTTYCVSGYDDGAAIGIRVVVLMVLKQMDSVQMGGLRVHYTTTLQLPFPIPTTPSPAPAAPSLSLAPSPRLSLLHLSPWVPVALPPVQQSAGGLCPIRPTATVCSSAVLALAVAYFCAFYGLSLSSHGSFFAVSLGVQCGGFPLLGFRHWGLLGRSLSCSGTFFALFRAVILTLLLSTPSPSNLAPSGFHLPTLAASLPPAPRSAPLRSPPLCAAPPRFSQPPYLRPFHTTTTTATCE